MGGCSEEPHGCPCTRVCGQLGGWVLRCWGWGAARPSHHRRYLLGHGVDEADVKVLLSAEPCGERGGVSPARAPPLPPSLAPTIAVEQLEPVVDPVVGFLPVLLLGEGRFGRGDDTSLSPSLWQLPKSTKSLGQVSASTARHPPSHIPCSSKGDGSGG